MGIEPTAIDWKDFGIRVALSRKARRYSQEEMAIQIGISRNYLSLIERGIADPSYTIVFAICKRLRLVMPGVTTRKIPDVHRWH
jgi:transcriptional regulator with XRE-family HTH domain